MADEESSDDEKLSAYSSISAKNITNDAIKRNSRTLPKQQRNQQHQHVNITNSNFDTKEEHTFYLNSNSDFNNKSVHSIRSAGTTRKAAESPAEKDEDDDSSLGDFVIEKKGSCNPPSSSSSTFSSNRGEPKSHTDITTQNPSLSQSSIVTNDSSKKQIRKKSVSFAADTNLPREDHIALSITKHLYTRELGYTQYQIQLLYRGFEWAVFKRYRDFASFHARLLAENARFQIAIPELPKKRWFEKQRWLNKFDESYSLHRKNALQEYLRLLAKTPIIKTKFQSFHEFLEIPLDKIKEQNQDLDDFIETESVEHTKYPQEGNHFIHDRNVNHSHAYPQKPPRNSIPDFEILHDDGVQTCIVGGEGIGRESGGSTESIEEHGDYKESFTYNEPTLTSKEPHQQQPYHINYTSAARGVHSQLYQKPIRPNYSPPPSRPNYQNHHFHDHQHHQKSSVPIRSDFRDSILETPLSQNFDDNGEVVVSRP